MTTTPQVPGCGFCNHPGFNTYEGDTCPECGRGTTPQPEKLIAGSTVISNPGATLRVEQLHLTEAGKKAITVQVQAADEGALRERARSLAEDWHEGVPATNVPEWCSRAAGALLALSTTRTWPTRQDVIDWAVGQWRAQVENRPLVNVHRRTLDDTWRQVIRFADGDPDELIGPAHDALLAASNGGST